MSKIFLSFVAPLVLLIIVVYFQYNYCSINILPRYGALLIIYGIFVDGQHLIRDKDGGLTLNSNSLTILGEVSSKKYKFAFLNPGGGLLLIIIGTFIWGFGDLICKCID